MIEKLHQGGIETAMITGDQSITATAVATKIGLTPRKDPKFIDSSRFDTMPPELLEALIRDTRIFCRVNPAQKLQIVRGFQAAGRVVAMTGDGINDGPALRAADIGIAMGLSGTDVAREVADVVLEKDNITSMSHAIREGRVAFRNLKRSVRFFVTANASDALLAVAAVTTRQGSALWRLRPVQTNILTDLAPGLALLMEPSNQRIESESPRSRLAPFFTLRESMGILGEAAVISAGSAMAGVYGMARYGLGPRTATLVFETLSAARVLHAFTCRPMASRRSGDRRGHSNRFLLMALLSALGAQIAIQLIPGLRRLLGVASLANLDFGVIGSLALATQKVNQTLRENRSPDAKIHV
jgi:Ca2+-transporting ATPase